MGTYLDLSSMRRWAAVHLRTSQQAASILLIVGVLFALLVSQVKFAPVALAQQSGVIIHDSVGDFTPLCATNTSLTVSDALGGELRLAATLEDYFSGAAVDTNRWLVGSANTWYTAPVTVVDGAVTLDAMYLRSQMNFASTQPRFFEARAFAACRWSQVDPCPLDLGFYRALAPPQRRRMRRPGAQRPFVCLSPALTTPSLSARVMASAPNPAYNDDLSALDLTQYHVYRVEWDGAETRYFVDGVQQATTPGAATLDTYAFLYSQTPAGSGVSPLRVDWARAGQYAPSGSFVSCPQDAGQPVAWSNLTLDATTPAGARR